MTLIRQHIRAPLRDPHDDTPHTVSIIDLLYHTHEPSISMSSFTTPFQATLQDDGQSWQVDAPFIYWTDLPRNEPLPNGLTAVAGVTISADSLRAVITVPVGYITDFASVPAIVRPLIDSTGLHAKAAALHDFLYSSKVDRKFADDTFYEAMGVLGVAKWRKQAMYWAVRLFGKSHWGT